MQPCSFTIMEVLLLSKYTDKKNCIKATKVYDWVQRKVKFSLIKFDGDGDDPCDKFDDICISELCKFLEKHPDFQVCCELIDDSIIYHEIGHLPARQSIVYLYHRMKLSFFKR